MEVMEMPVKKTTEQQFIELYRSAFPAVASFVRKMNGTLADSKDVFHDALVIYHEKLSDPDFLISVSPEAYILGITKHLWISEFRSSRNQVSLDHAEVLISIPDDYYATPNTKRLLRFLEVTGRKCMELLTAFYYERLSAKELLNRFGYRTEHSASVQKYKCIEKAREALKQKSISYEDFLE